MESLKLYQEIFDLYVYTHKFIRKFPKSERFLISLSLQEALLEGLKATIRSNNIKQKESTQKYCEEIKVQLEIYMVSLRLAKKLNFLSNKKYGVASKKLLKIFKIYAGWKNYLQKLHSNL